MNNIELRSYEELIVAASEFFTAKITNPVYFEEIKQYCKNNQLLKRILNHDVFLDLGYLTRDDFMHFAMAKKIVRSVPIQPLELIINVLTENLVILHMGPNTMNNTHSLYHVNPIKALYYYSNGLLLNRIFGFKYIIEKYTPSIYKIENINKGNAEIGNGFLIPFYEKKVIVTNNHVIEGAEKVNVKDHNEKVIKIDKIIIDDKNDLAFLIPKSIPKESLPFMLNLNFNVLEEILTIGYPPIPTTKASYPLFHLGEVNSFVEDYWGNSLFIFSAKTNPGNSGSPIIDKDGSILGIVTRQLEEQDWYKKSKIPYYAGIPSTEILRFWNEQNKE